VGTAFPHLFALDYIKTWLQTHRCASNTQIRTDNQKPTIKQGVPVWKFLWANTHFIRTIWFSLLKYQLCMICGPNVFWIKVQNISETVYNAFDFSLKLLSVLSKQLALPLN